MACQTNLGLPVQVISTFSMHTSARHEPDGGHPDMEMWRILALVVLKQGLGCDSVNLQELVNRNHERFSLQTGHIMSNVALLTLEYRREVNQPVVSVRHEVSKKLGGELATRYDSFVVETHVHNPTDVNLLWDTTRCLVGEMYAACAG